MIQDASYNEIHGIDVNTYNNLELYSKYDELIVINTINDPFNNHFYYELDQMEIELGNIFLFEKSLDT
jgi:hypothetical protein